MPKVASWCLKTGNRMRVYSELDEQGGNFEPSVSRVPSPLLSSLYERSVDGVLRCSERAKKAAAEIVELNENQPFSNLLES